MIDRFHGFVSRRRYPRLAGGTIAGVVGGMLGIACLAIAVPTGLSASIEVGVALTWIGVLLGVIGALTVVGSALGYVSLWSYEQVRGRLS